jgi:hypothetical protein
MFVKLGILEVWSPAATTVDHITFKLLVPTQAINSRMKLIRLRIFSGFISPGIRYKMG